MRYLSLIILFIWSCKANNPDFQKDAAQAALINESFDKLTQTIIHDIFSPPVASRIYAYTSIGAYEAAIAGDSNYISLAGQLHGLTAFPKPEKGVDYCYPLASHRAFLVLAKKFTFSEDSITAHENAMMKKYEKIGIPKEVKERSLAFGEAVAKHIIAWSDSDNYKQSRSFPKFSVTQDLARWKPTPPGYMDAIEPHWNTIRTFVIDSAQQFRPLLPTKFDTLKNSQFYKEMVEVYQIGKTSTEEQKQIASFWDCNPYKLNVVGHVTHATKKITPGGHWMSIAHIAAKKSNANYKEAALTYALTALCLVDGFISCWDEKYRSNVIRPESVINQYIDPSWTPYLQTPPFPEYTSGHSVISSASAVALTSIFGDNFAFDDDTELRYGIPVRSFKSFYEAGDEASVSRLYGGIHYRPAIDNGVKQGKALGEFIVKKIKMKR